MEERVTIYVCPECGFGFKRSREQLAQDCVSWELCTGSSPTDDRGPLHRERRFETVEVVPASQLSELEAENERLRKAAEYERWIDDAACHDATCSYRPEIERRTIEAEQLANQAEARLERAERALREADETDSCLHVKHGEGLRPEYCARCRARSYFSTEGESSDAA